MNPVTPGLPKPNFRAADADYAGPQQRVLLDGIRSATSSTDSIVTLAGPTGCGKTVSLRNALGELDIEATSVRLSRVYLQREDVLEALLNEFGVEQQPASNVQRFNALKSLLTRRTEDGSQVFIIVEDAAALGVNGLVELESLTAADEDQTPGAHLVLMGAATLKTLLEHPDLARLQQRIRRRLRLEPFSIDETRSYLQHYLDKAGHNGESPFSDDAVRIVQACSGGLARAVNTMTEALLFAAEEASVTQVGGDFAREIALRDFDFEASVDVPADEVAPSTITDAGSSASSADDAQADAMPTVETSAHESASAACEADNEIPDLSAFLDTADVSSASDDDLDDGAASADQIDDDGDDQSDELIQDTQPSLPTLDGSTSSRSEPREHEDAESAAARLAGWREKTDATHPSLPVLQQTPENSDAAAEAPQTEDRAETESAAEEQTVPEADSRVHLEPRTPERLSKSDAAADTQTTRALDSALLPDTALLRTLVDPLANPDDAEPTAAADVDALPTLSDALDIPALSADDMIQPAAAPSAGSREADDASLASPEEASSDSVQTETAPSTAEQSSVEVTADSAPAAQSPPATPDCEAEGDLDAPANEEAAKENVTGLSLVPEITLDKSLESHQQEAELKREQAAAGSDDDGETPEERKRRLEELSARFSEARSLEDVVDDVAAETLFGEEFSQLAAAVSAMNDNDIAAAENAAAEAEASAGESVSDAVSQQAPAVVEPLAVVGDAPTAEARGNANASDKPPSQPVTQPAATAANGAAPPTPPKPPEGAANLGSSAAERLEMVRALNLKAGKAMPNVPADRGEEIVLGRGGKPRKPGCPQPAPIENQFGLSMTAKLRALSAENIQQMQEAEAAAEAAAEEEKKGGLLRRFKRS